MFINSFFNFILKICTKTQDFNFIAQDDSQKFIPLIQRNSFQQMLSLLISKRNIDTDLINQPSHFLNIQNLPGQFLTDFLILLTISHEKFFNRPNHCFLQINRKILFFQFKSCHFCFQIRQIFLQFHQFCPFNSLYQNPQHIFWHLDYLFNLCNRSYFVKILKPGLLHLWISLRNQKNLLILGHGFFHSLDGFSSADVKMYNHLRKNRGSTKSDCRHSLYQIVHSFPPLRRFPVFLHAWKRIVSWMVLSLHGSLQVLLLPLPLSS